MTEQQREAGTPERPEAPVEVTAALLGGWSLPRPGSDKESRGRILVVGGSTQTAGAVLLAGEAALRVGGGKLQLATARGVAAPLAVAVPESRVLPLADGGDGLLHASAASDVVGAAGGAAVVLVGPGLVEPSAVVELLEGIVPHLDTTVVVDALASAYLTSHPDGLRHLAGRAVLTVNPQELSKVLDRDEAAVGADPAPHALEAAARTGAVVLCGATQKCIATPEGDQWVVRAGGPGLGVSGSGDVQAGIVAGLLARGAEPAQAAVWGGYLHGQAGERLAVSVGPLGFLAREVSGELPGLLSELTG
jgi:hydroxyethylthiazole kinase-like uncharacterized protein yjeF